ncbi:hypothetical protein Tco_0711400 [Tanacetum coccineum]
MDDDQEEAKMKEHMEIVLNEEEIAIDAIPLATKPPSIVNWKIHKEEKKSYYQIIRANGSSKLFLTFSAMLRSFDTKDLETLWKLVKDRFKSTKLVEDLDLMFCWDLETMFQNMQIYMLVEKRYPLKSSTITEMLNKKLQADHWNEMCYQLLKLITKQLKDQ